MKKKKAQQHSILSRIILEKLQLCLAVEKISERRFVFCVLDGSKEEEGKKWYEFTLKYASRVWYFKHILTLERRIEARRRARKEIILYFMASIL
jgi:hypothetical protein